MNVDPNAIIASYVNLLADATHARVVAETERDAALTELEQVRQIITDAQTKTEPAQDGENA